MGNNMKKIALAMIVALMAMLPVAFAVQLSVTATKALGGTGQVEIISPDADGAIESISWVLDTNPPYNVTGVKITWTPASDTATYTVAVTLYDSDGTTIVGYGTATQTGSTGSVTTSITLNTPVDPANIYYVEVVIAEQ